jgi:large subunit ribosomal protein L9
MSKKSPRVISKLNQEMGGVAEQLDGMLFTFAARASETGRLYGSVNTQMLADAVSEELGISVEAKQIESQPLRIVGKHKVAVRLTVDLIPEIDVIVHREGESPLSALDEEEQQALQADQALEDFEELAEVPESDEEFVVYTEEDADADAAADAAAAAALAEDEPVDETEEQPEEAEDEAEAEEEPEEAEEETGTDEE